MDQDGTWHGASDGGGPRSRSQCARWEPSSPSPKSAQSPPPIFGPLILSPNGWMDQDATWYGGNIVAGDIVLDGVPAFPPIGSTAASSAHVYCGHGRPSQLPLSSCLFVYEISREPLNGSAPYSQGRRAWSLARMNVKVKVGGQMSRSPGTRNDILALSTACVRFMFGKTSLASS